MDIEHEISIESAGIYIGVFTADQYETAYGERPETAYAVRTHGDGLIFTDDRVEALAFAVEVAEDTAEDDLESRDELGAFISELQTK